MALHAKIVAVAAIAILVMPMSLLAVCLLDHTTVAYESKHCQMINRQMVRMKVITKRGTVCCTLSNTSLPVSTRQENAKYSHDKILYIENLDNLRESKSVIGQVVIEEPARNPQAMLCTLLI